MRNKETLYLIIGLAICFFLLYGCNTKKKVVETEQTTELSTKNFSVSQDSCIFELKIDTSKYCETSVIIERTEYYPSVYTDSLENAVKPLKKAVIRKVITTNKSDNGKLEVKSESNIIDTSVELKDSTGSYTQTESVRTANRSCSLWWLLILLVIVYLIIRFK